MVGILFFISGCTEVDLPTPEDVIKRPLGTESVKLGMTKEQVVDLWGEPDNVKYQEIDESGDIRSRELWIYKGRYSQIPVDAGYLSKSKYLYFDGKNLAKISEVELIKEE